MLEYTEYLRRRSTPPTHLHQVINEVRARWRMKLALRGVAWAAGISVALFLLAAYAMEWARFTPVSIIGARVLLAAAILASIYYFLRAAAAPPGHRRTGGAVPRGTRAVAAGHARQCRRSQPPGRRFGVGGPDSPPGRTGAGGLRVHQRRAPRRRRTASPLGRDAGRPGGCRRADRDARSRVRAQRAVGDPARAAERRGGGAVPHRSAARQRQRAEGRRPDDHRDARRVRRRGCVADGAARPRPARSRRCRSCAATTATTRGSSSTSARRSNTSSRPTASARRSSS